MAKKAAASKTDKINRVTGTVIRVSLKVIAVILIVVIFFYGITSAYQFGLSVFSEKTMTAEPGIEMQVTIQEGDSALTVGNMLEGRGLIHDARAFVFQKYFYEKTLEPGVYTVDTAMTVKEVLEVLSGSGEEESEEAEE